MHIINIAILFSLPKSMPVINPAVIVSVSSASLFGPIIEQIELKIPSIIAII